MEIDPGGSLNEFRSWQPYAMFYPVSATYDRRGSSSSHDPQNHMMSGLLFSPVPMYVVSQQHARTGNQHNSSPAAPVINIKLLNVDSFVEPVLALARE